MKRPLRFAGAVVLAAGWGFWDGYFTTPWPAGFWVSLICGLACIAWEQAAAKGSSTLAALSAVGVQLCLQPVLPALLARAHRIPMAAALLWPALSAAGIDAGTDAAGNLILEGSTGVHAIAVTWELAALPTILRLAVAIAFVGGGRCAFRNLVMLTAWGAVRLAAIIALVASGARVSVAYEPAVTMIMMLPLAFLLVAPRAGPATSLEPVVRATPWAATMGRAGRAARMVCGALLLGLAGASLGWSLAHRDAGAAAGGRVLIDESRSDWEWTSQPFDHARYGQRSLYNYSLWKSWIELHHPTRVLDRPPTEQDLAGADVLIVKTPTSPYDGGTVARIERFVRRGGGLYLIGDHTNLFGMSAVLNRIAAPFGLSFQYDDTFPLDHETSDIFRPPAPATHPVLRGIRAYPFETSCTLRVPLRGEPLIIGRRLGSEAADYGQPNFFGNMTLDPSDTFGLFVQAAAVAHGRGRVVAFTDSTNFSNFSMLWPGRRELTLNVIDWLNRPSTGGGRLSPWLLPGAACLLCVMGAIALRSCGIAALTFSIWLGIGAGWYGLHVSTASTLAAFDASATRSPRAASESLAFDTSLSTFQLEETSPLFSRGPADAYNAFFINSARSGLWPVLAASLDETLSGRAAAIIRPCRVPSETDMRALTGFLRRGGRLLILDSVLNTKSTTRLIAGAFGLVIQDQLLPLAQPDGRPRVPALAMVQPGGQLRGARRRVTRGGATVVSTDVGAGRLLVVFDAALFSDRSYGGVYATPTAEQVEVFEAQKEVLRMLLEPASGEASR